MEDRIAVVAARFGHNVLIAIFSAVMMIYRHSSEILHGTYFGALYFWGLTTGTKPDSLDELKITMGNHQFSVLCAAIFANTAMLECVGEYFELPDLAKESNLLMKELEEMPLVKEALSSPGKK
ncbi:MAG: hypothetical protein WD715_03115 [Dongiaceae bacterium]